MRGIFGSIWEKKKIIQITFEIFWTVIFLLNMLSNQTGGSVPQFIYVNF